MNNIPYQVVVFVENDEATISKELDQLNKVMFNRTWILQVVLNGSEDSSVVEVAKFGEQRSSGKNVHLWEYDHHEDKDELKRKIVEEIIVRSEQYPIIVFWDDIPAELRKIF